MGASHWSNGKNHEKKVENSYISNKKSNYKKEKNTNIFIIKADNRSGTNENNNKNEKNKIYEMMNNVSIENLQTKQITKTDYSNAPDREVKEYEEFCNRFKFIEKNNITVKVNEIFAQEFSINNSVHPKFQKKNQSIESKDKEIELIERRRFYTYSIRTFEDITHIIYVFKATKKGNFKINFTSETVNVNVK